MWFILVFSRLRELCEAAVADLVDLTNVIMLLQYAEFYGALWILQTAEKNVLLAVS